VGEFGGLGGKIHDQVSQTCTCGELADEQGHALAPPMKGSKFLAVMMCFCQRIKIMSGRNATICLRIVFWCATGSDLLVLVSFFAKTV
jgi:hypothetical protein